MIRRAVPAHRQPKPAGRRCTASHRQPLTPLSSSAVDGAGEENGHSAGRQLWLLVIGRSQAPILIQKWKILDCGRGGGPLVNRSACCDLRKILAAQ